MATIRRRILKNGKYVWDLDFTYRGKRSIISTKTSNRRVAREILAEIEVKIARGTFNLADYEKKDTSIGNFMKEYFHHAESFKKQTTIINEKIIAKQFQEFVGPGRICRSIDKKILDDWAAELASRVRPATFNIQRRFLHAAFNVAKSWGYVDENPISGVAKIPVDEVRSFFTKEEIDKLFALIDSDIMNQDKKHFVDFNRQFRLFIEFLLNTGLRRTEAIMLTIDHVDFNRSVIFIQHTKGKKLRTIPLNSRAVEILKELRPNLFTKVNPASMTHKFGDVMVRLKLKGLKLHSLRHTFATNLVRMGVDIYAVKELLGHQDIRTSMVYAKADTETLRRAVDQLKQ
jgi:integrase